MTKLIAARVQARIEKKQIEIAPLGDEGVGGGPFRADEMHGRE